MSQSLMTLWQDGTHPDRHWFATNYLPRLNPVENFTLINVNAQTGAWDFSYADTVAGANPNAAMTVRPFAYDENYQWQKKDPEQWILDAKARLEGRKYRVTIGCEPSFTNDELTAFLKWLVKAAEMAHKHDQPISIGGWQSQAISAFTQHPDDLLKGKFDTLIKVTGQLKPVTRISWHTYTGLWLPAGTYNDDYLRRIADEPELLRDKHTWHTWEQITDRRDLQRYRTRHLFRHLWFAYRAEDIGVTAPDYAIEESPFDYYGSEWDLKHTWQRAKDITGIDEVSGINELEKFMQWKNPTQSWIITAADNLEWYGTGLAHDPNCRYWALYCVSGQIGDDRQPYNWGARKDILERMIGKNPVRYEPLPPPPVPPPAPPPSEPTLQSLDARVKALETTVAQLTGDHR